MEHAHSIRRRWFGRLTRLGLSGVLLLSGLVVVAWWVALANGRGIPSVAWERFRESRAGGQTYDWKLAVSLGTWLAAVVTTVVVMVTLLTMRWWLGDAKGSGPGEQREQRERSGRFFRLMVFGAVLVAMLLRLPLARGSLWWDELWNVRYATLGEWREARGGGREFREWSWDRAFWYYGKPTNHAVQTVPAKLVERSWRAVRGEPAGGIHEVALRLPVLLAGLGAVWCVAVLGKRWAGERAGLAAAWVMALHPWLLRYGVDARSYGMTMLIVPLTLLSAWEAWRIPGGGAWRWWLLLAVGFCLMMWSHALAHGFLCLGLFGTGMVVIARVNGDPVVRRLLMIRLTVLAALAACVFLILFLPCLLQAVCWHGRNADGNLLTLDYLKRTLGAVSSGEEGIGHAAVLLFLLPALAGLLVRGQLDGLGRLLCLAVLAGSVMLMAVTALTGGFFYHRFVMALGPVLAVGWGVAMGSGKLPRWLAPAGVAVLGLSWIPQLRVLTGRSYCPWRETAGLLREQMGRPGEQTVVAGYGLGANLLQCYLPGVVDLRGRDLDEVLAEARRKGNRLCVAWAYQGFHEAQQPAEMAALRDPSQFRVLAVFPGIEEQFDCRVVEWVAGP
jgi:hypothetical protein